MIRHSGIARAEALASGSVALALFAWFVLSACGGGGSAQAPPPAPGADAGYEDAAVHDSPDGSNVFGDMHCDKEGKYRGGGDPASEESTKRALEAAEENARQELKEIDQKLSRCKGQSMGKLPYEYDRELGCDRNKLQMAQTKAGKAADAVDASRQALKDLKLGEIADEDRIRHMEYEATRKYDSIAETYVRRDYQKQMRATAEEWKALRPMTKKAIADEEAKLKSLRADLAAAQQEKGALEASCAPADKAIATDPCSGPNFRALDAKRSTLLAQAAMHKNRREQFAKCIDDRKRQAKAPSSRPAVDPAVIQMLPGILSRPSSRPSQPQPAPSHQHKE